MTSTPQKFLEWNLLPRARQGEKVRMRTKKNFAKEELRLYELLHIPRITHYDCFESHFVTEARDLVEVKSRRQRTLLSHTRTIQYSTVITNLLNIVVGIINNIRLNSKI